MGSTGGGSVSSPATAARVRSASHGPSPRTEPQAVPAAVAPPTTSSFATAPGSSASAPARGPARARRLPERGDRPRLRGAELRQTATEGGAPARGAQGGGLLRER